MGEIKFPIDKVIPFYLGNKQVRGRLVRLGGQFHKILTRHAYPSIINQYLAEMVALAVSLSVDAKYQGTFTLQITNARIVKMMVVDINTAGEIRACAKWNQESLDQLLAETNNKPSLTQLFENGFMVFTADLSNQVDRYQAIVELIGSTLSECMHHFFRQSDQIQTGLVLVSSIEELNGNYLASAIILQKMPSPLNQTEEQIEKDEENWFTSLSLLGTATKQELLDKNLSAEDILFRLFHEQEVYVLPEKHLIEKCSCSRQKVKDMLSNFQPEDIHYMMVDDCITVTCEFCSESYKFENEEIKELLQLQ